ncbi:MAG: 6,7-dimethyl-8-ribityllumazine synthase [Chitinophagaceae bacterium]|jgi:6,7-dimethyl-8-ribityllumazine synthase|nr:6,7-dimethyl-8-ribityllumazine synthase [Chitinophagaceae bacterium]
MASQGNQQLTAAASALNIGNAKVVIVKTAWNAHITDELSMGCKRVLLEHGVEVVELTVPGAVELTFGIQRYLNAHSMVNACIALGCVIRGDTPHFEYVCQSVTQGITMINTTSQVPVIFGVLTVDNEQQALERIGGKHGHKGEEAAMTALQMIDFVRRF